MRLNANYVLGFYSGVIKKDEFEELIRNIVKDQLPEAVVEELIYGKRGVLVRTDQELIEIAIDFEELIIEE